MTAMYGRPEWTYWSNFTCALVNNFGSTFKALEKLRLDNSQYFDHIQSRIDDGLKLSTKFVLLHIDD